MNPLLFAKLWMTIRPFHQLKLRREERRAAEAGLPTLPTPAITTEHPPEHVETVINAAAALVGAGKSKLIWLAVAQALYGLVQLYINDGALTAVTVEPFVTGLFTAVFRIYTGSTLSEKGSA